MTELRILISDTSVLIDLERGGLLEAAFSLPLEFAVPDLLFRQELEPFNGSGLVELGLKVISLAPTTVAKAQAYHHQAKGLSVPDSFALALASDHKCALLSGDGILRKLAEAENIECRGVLWVTDQLNLLEIVSAKALCDGLQKIFEHPRCRLPKREVTMRIRDYGRRLIDET